MANYIDIHTHILPEMDDGSKSWDETLQMCRIAVEDGIKTIVLTPHIRGGVYWFTEKKISKKANELKKHLKQHGIPLNITTGADVHIDPETLSLIEKGIYSIKRQAAACLRATHRQATTSRHGKTNWTDSEGRPPEGLRPGMAEIKSSYRSSRQTENSSKKGTLSQQDLTSKKKKLLRSNSIKPGKKYVLIELPDNHIPQKMDENIFNLLIKGIAPILTHPERNYEIQKNPQKLYELVNKGLLAQVTASSITGGFGIEAKKTAEILIRHRLVHIIASDAHSVNWRPPVLTEAVKTASQFADKEFIQDMVTTYPEAVINGEEIMLPEPVEIRKPKNKTFIFINKIFSAAFPPHKRQKRARGLGNNAPSNP